jgi:hypothetical protein
MSTCAARYLALLIMALLPIPVHAQRPVLFTVTVMASIKVYRGPSVERRVVGYLEPGMPASVFACREDCVWLDIGPSVWIQSSDVVVNGPLPEGYTLPTAESTASAITQNQTEPVQAEQATTITATQTGTSIPAFTEIPALTPLPSNTPSPPMLTETPTLLPAQAPVSAATVPDCSANTYNCPAFSTHNEAQGVFEYCRNLEVSDVHDLDRNHDGAACEDLP